MAYVRDLAFRSDTGDLDLRTGDIVFLEDIYAIAQNVGFRLQFFQGECFLDLRQGMPYFTQIFQKNAPPALVKSVFYNAILNSPGIIHVNKCDLFQTGNRLAVNWTAQSVVGPISQVDNLIFSTSKATVLQAARS